MKLLFPIASLLISGTLFFAVVSPLYKDVSGLRNEVTAYNSALDNATYLQKTQDSLLDQYKNIKDTDKLRLENFLPNTVNNIEFILELEQIANLHNMPLKNIKFETPKTNEKVVAKPQTTSMLMPTTSASNTAYGTFAIEFTTEGTYSSFASFLKDVEHNLRLVDIKSISFTTPPPPSKGDVSDPNIYTYTLKVDTYWLK